jgi:toxin-antitoxin system PIN domain toxin
MVVVDTNVLVYASRVDSPFHLPCLEVIERLRSQQGAWFATWSIVYEFVRVVTHRGSTTRPWALGAAWDFVEALFEAPGFAVLAPTARHVAVAGEVFRELPDLSGRIVHDAHVAILMREHGIRRIYTRDVDFHRFPFVEPVDPVRVPPRAAEPTARYRRRRRRPSARV